MITLSAVMLIFHTLSTAGFLATGSTHAFVATYSIISLVGVVVGVLAVFILPNVHSEKKGTVAFLSRGVSFFLLIWLAQVLGSSVRQELDYSPTVAIFSAGILLLPLYSLMTATVSVIYLSDLPNRSERLGKWIPPVMFRNVVIPGFAIWVTYSTLVGILSPSEDFTASITSVVIPILFIFGLFSVREKLIAVLGTKVGETSFSLLSVVYVASLGTVLIFEMGSSSFDLVIHETMVETSPLFSGSNYESQMNLIRIFSVFAGVMTIIGTLVPMILNFKGDGVSHPRSINFLTKSITVAIFYLIGASILTGSVSVTDEHVTVTPVETLGEESGIMFASTHDSVELLVCSDYELQNRIYPVDSLFGIAMSIGYDIEFEQMQVTQISDMPVELPTLAYCTNIVLHNITAPEAWNSAPQAMLGIRESTYSDSIIVIMHSDGKFLDIGSYTAPSDEESGVGAYSLLGSICSIPVILIISWRIFRVKGSADQTNPDS